MPPAAAGAAVAGVGSALGVGGALFGHAKGVGKSTYDANNFSQTAEYDPNRFNYGGTPGGAAAASNAYGGKAGEYGAQQQTLYNRGSNELDLGNEARGGQAAAANAMLARANGNDLVSRMLAAEERRKLVAEGASGAASAQGPAAVALAQQNAQAATAQGMAGLGASEQIAGAQEKLANLQGAGAMFGNMRQGDVSSANTAFGAGAQSGQLGAQYSSLQHQVNQDQLNAGMHQQDLLSGSNDREQNIESQVAQNNANRDMDYLKMALGGVSGGTQAGAQIATPAPGGPPKPKAVGGGLGHGHAYVVGEEGPELIVPKDDGFVLTAPQTAVVLSTLTPQQERALGKARPEARALGGQVLGGGQWEDPFSAPEAYAMKDGGIDVMGTIDKINQPVNAMFSPGAMTSGSAWTRAAGGAVLGLSPESDGFGSATGTTVLTPDGAGMDVMGSLKANSDFATQYQGSPMGQPFVSDPAAKEEAFELGVRQGAMDTHRMYSDPAYAKRIGAEAEPSQLGGVRIVAEEAPQAPRKPAPSKGAFDNARRAVTLASNMAVPAAIPAARLVRSIFAPPEAEPIQFPTEVDREAPRPLVAAKPQVTWQKSVVGPNGRRERYPDLKDPLDPAYAEPGPAPVMTPGGHIARAVEDVDRRTAPVSDPRAKVLGGVHDNEVSDVLDETPAVSYKYKSEYFEPGAQKPGERQAGFLTSDLKKTPLGAAVVEERPDGYEGYNVHRMIGLEFAGLRNVHERLRELEASLGKRKKAG